MPNDPDFALLYQRLIDHNFEAAPRELARTRDNLIAMLSSQSPPAQTKHVDADEKT